MARLSLWLLLAAGLTLLLGAVAPSLGSPARVAGPPTVGPLEGATEVPSLRTARSRTYERPDGTRVAEVSAAPVNYRDEAGRWRPIDATLVTDERPGYAYRNRADATIARLPARLGAAPVRLESGDAWLTFDFEGVRPSAGERTGDGVRYPNALTGVEVRYHSLPGALKEDLILAGPEAERSFSYRLKLSAGLSAHASQDGSIELRDADGAVRFAFAAPFMKDAGEGPTSLSNKVGVALSEIAGGYRLTYRASDAWLDAPERRYPVVLDPTAEYQAYIPANVVAGNLVDRDAYIANGIYANDVLSYGSAIFAGDFGSFRTRALMRFDLALPGTTGGVIPKEAEILDAWMLARPAATSGGAPAVEVRALNEAWDQQASWNNAKTATPWSAPGGGTPDAPVDTNNGNLRPSGVQFPGWYEWSIAPLVRQWVAGTRVNNGLILQTVNEPANQWVAFESINSSNSSAWPRMYVSYRPTAIGASSSQEFVSETLNDPMSAQVNVASGNLMVQATDLAIAGTGLDLAVTRTYNSGSIDQSPNFGKNWNSSATLDVGLVVFPSGAATFFGPTGEAANFRRLANGNYEAPPELDATLVVNASGAHTLTFNDTGEVFRFQGPTLTSREDRHGNDITYAAAVGPKLTGITDTQNRTLTPTHDTANRIVKLTDASGRFVEYRYDANGRMDRFTDAAGNHTTYAYAGTTNELVTITDPLGNETRITYLTTATGARKVASLSRVLNPTGPVLATTTFSYSSNVTACPAATLPDAKSIGTTTVTDPMGQTTVYCWDADRRVTKVSDPAVTTSTTWTGSDLPATITTPGGTTSNTYDASGLRLTETTDPTGAKTKFEYGSTSAPYQPTKVTDPQGILTYYAYDAAGNRCLVRHDRAPQGTVPCADATGAFARLVHNADGTLASATDANGNTTTYGYDTLGRLTSITPPSPLGAETRTYDGLSRLKTRTDGKGQTTTYSYNALDRITKVEHHDGSQVSATYNANGNLLTQTDGAGTTTRTYDRLGRLITETPPSGPQVTYAYDTSGNLTSLTDGGGTVTYQYAGTAGRLSSLTQPDSSQIAFGYDGDGNRNQVSYPNGVVVDTVFDGAAKETSIVAKKGSTTLASFAYGYADSQSQPTSVIQSVTDENGAVTRYTYNTPGRLVRARTTASGGAVTADFQYGYDAAGNRTSQDLNGAQTTFSYNAANQLTQSGSTTYSHDQNGNLTGNSAGLSLSYNAANQTTAITPAGGSAVSMSYRGTGQTDRTEAGSTQMQLSSLGVSGTADPSGSTYYTRTPDGEILAQRGPAATHYFVRDALGSVVALTDGAGAVASRFSYDPFGQEISTTGSVTTPWRFAGAYFDAPTGLYKIGERFYDPGLGRWTQQDAVFDATQFTQSNRYIYVGGDPLNFFDPTGLATTRDKKCMNTKSKNGKTGNIMACNKKTGSMREPIGAFLEDRVQPVLDLVCGYQLVKGVGGAVSQGRIKAGNPYVIVLCGLYEGNRLIRSYSARI